MTIVFTVRKWCFRKLFKFFVTSFFGKNASRSEGERSEDESISHLTDGKDLDFGDVVSFTTDAYTELRLTKPNSKKERKYIINEAFILNKEKIITRNIFVWAGFFRLSGALAPEKFTLLWDADSTDDGEVTSN